MKIIEKIVECIVALLPFLRKKNAKEIKEFSELITGQYGFLIEQLEKVLKDYFELSAKVKEMHTEMFALKQQLVETLEERCRNRDCTKRDVSGIYIQ